MVFHYFMTIEIFGTHLINNWSNGRRYINIVNKLSFSLNQVGINDTVLPNPHRFIYKGIMFQLHFQLQPPLSPSQASILRNVLSLSNEPCCIDIYSLHTRPYFWSYLAFATQSILTAEHNITHTHARLPCLVIVSIGCINVITMTS